MEKQDHLKKMIKEKSSKWNKPTKQVFKYDALEKDTT